MSTWHPGGGDRRDEIRRELEGHVAERVDELVSGGMSEEEARDHAAKEFGDLRAAEREMAALAERNARLGGLRRTLEAFIHDLRAALRGLRRQPGFGVMAILAIAAGVGATTAIFSVVDGVLLRPLNYDEPSRIVTLWAVTPEGNTSGSPSYPDFRDWREQTHGFEAMAFIRGAAFTHLNDERGASLIRTALVSQDFGAVLRAPTHLGSLAPMSDANASEPVMALKYSTWVNRFAADPSVVGRVEPFAEGGLRVVAVLAPGVDYPLWADAFVPLTPERVESSGLDVRQYRLDTRVVARLAPGASLDEARAELQAVGARLAERYPESNDRYGIAARPLRELLVGDVRTSLMVLLAGVTALLLIACANVASLGLARTLDRARELGVRASLGAARGRLAGQLMVESLVVAVLGGALGVLVASWGVNAFLTWGVPGLPRSQEIEIDGRILVFAVVTACAAGILAGVLPAVLGSRATFMTVLRGGRPAQASELLRAGLVTGQVAVTVALLAATGLLTRSFVGLERVDTGFDPEPFVTLRMILPATYQGRPAERQDLYERVLEGVRAGPDVEEATLINHVPLSGTGVLTALSVEGVDPDHPPSAWLRTTSSDFFEVMGLPIVAGRAFDPSDDQAWAGGFVISEALARQLWGGEDPLGRRITAYRQLAADADFGQPIEGTVIGVAANTRTVLRATGPTASIYMPMSVHPWATAYLLVRPRPSATVLDDVRTAVLAADPRIPVEDMVPLAELARFSVSRDRFLASLSVVFSVVAVFLALTGTYGVLSYAVRRRTRDLAVRVALGSGSGRVVRLVLRGAAIMVGSGVLVGLLVALILTRFMGSVLYQVSPMDPVAFAGSVLVVLLMGLIGAWIPARRAADVDPMLVLRD